MVDSHERIWTRFEESKYGEKRDELLALMENFELCFELGNTGEFIAPELLSPNAPGEYKPIKRKGRLTFVYRYDFMPAGMLTRFIVKIHRHIERNTFWKHGVVINFEGTRAAILEDVIQKSIRIDVEDKQNKKELLAIVRKEFMEIYQDFNKKIRYEELVPCNCSLCRDDADEPHYFKWKTLCTFVSRQKKNIPCEISALDVGVNQLVGEISAEINASPISMTDGIGVYNLGDLVEDPERLLENSVGVRDTWWKKALMAGCAVGVVVFSLLALPSDWLALRWAIIAFAFATGILFFKNPKTRYMRAFWGVFSGWSALNLFPQFQLAYRSASESDVATRNEFFGLLTSGPEAIVNIGSIAIMILLLFLDFRERKE